MFKIKSEELELDGEFETAFAVFGKGDDVQCIFGGTFDDAEDMINLLSGVARLLPRIAEIIGIPVARLGAALVVLSAIGADSECIAGDFADADAISAICDELGVEMPR